MQHTTMIKWMLSVIALTSILTLGAASYGIHHSGAIYRDMLEANAQDSLRRESKLSHDLTQMIEMRSEGVSNAFIMFEQDNLIKLRKMAALEVASQLHGQTREVYKSE